MWEAAPASSHTERFLIVRNSSGTPQPTRVPNAAWRTYRTVVSVSRSQYTVYCSVVAMTTPMMLFKVVFLLTTVISLTTGFLPTSATLKAVEFLRFTSNGQKTITHGDITRQALLQIAAVIFISNPNPNYQGSAQDVQRLLDSDKELDISGLIEAYYSNKLPKESLTRRKAKFCKSICDITKYNGQVDMVELRIAAAHFDSEQFESAQTRLVCLRNLATLLISRRGLGQLDNRDSEYDNARKYVGRLLHTLQDFYSHTNWIENHIGESVIATYSVLGQSNKMIENVAKLANPCLDCRKVRNSMFMTALDLMSLGLIIESTSIYECNNNIDESLKSQNLLTSGYSKGGKNGDDEVIVKPEGKCSHGGIIDGSTDQSATGGINKDSSHKELASHHYYHSMAADVAQDHSYEFLSRLRKDVDNDPWFMEFLGLDKLTITIAVVIDTTLWTTKNLDETQQMISQTSANMQQHMKDMTVQYILVPLSNTGTYT